MSEFETLDPRDLRRVVKLLPAELVELCEEYNHADEGPMIGGGVVRAAVTGERVSDIDVFAFSEKAAATYAAAYLQRFDGRGTSYPTENAITALVRGRKPVQFIKRWWFDGAQSLIESFDFSIARAAIWYHGGEWRSLCDARFYRDLAARRLVFMDPKHNTAGGTLLRIGKFIRRGYRISAFQTSAIVSALARQAGAADGTINALKVAIREVDPRSPEWADPPAPSSTPVDESAPSDDDMPF